ncbi:MAG: cation transporter [Nitrospirae bacterium]|nr:cation transporter [Nitrospirota bacterium]
MNNYREVRRVLIITLILNLVVASAKVTYGAMTQSLSMLADGFHSLFDGTSNLVGLLGIWMASHPPDSSHPYGHKKYEALASLGISLLLFLTGYNILTDAYHRFSDLKVPEVTLISFLVMLGTIGINFFTVSYERRKSAALKSEILHADALHTRSDLLASFSVLISLAAVLGGYPLMDPIAALLIAALIGKTGFEILLESARVLSDASMLSADRIKHVAMTVEGVRECHAIRTRGTADHVYVDLHLLVPPSMDTEDAHQLAHQVEDRIKQEFREVSDVVVHVEPDPLVELKIKK